MNGAPPEAGSGGGTDPWSRPCATSAVPAGRSVTPTSLHVPRTNIAGWLSQLPVRPGYLPLRSRMIVHGRRLSDTKRHEPPSMGASRAKSLVLRRTTSHELDVTAKSVPPPTYAVVFLRTSPPNMTAGTRSRRRAEMKTQSRWLEDLALRSQMWAAKITRAVADARMYCA